MGRGEGEEGRRKSRSKRRKRNEWYEKEEQEEGGKRRSYLGGHDHQKYNYFCLFSIILAKWSGKLYIFISKDFLAWITEILTLSTIFQLSLCKVAVCTYIAAQL